MGEPKETRWLLRGYIDWQRVGRGAAWLLLLSYTIGRGIDSEIAGGQEIGGKELIFAKQQYTTELPGDESLDARSLGEFHLCPGSVSNLDDVPRVMSSHSFVLIRAQQERPAIQNPA